MSSMILIMSFHELQLDEKGGTQIHFGLLLEKQILE